MSEVPEEEILQAMRQRRTEELEQIWAAYDHSEWSPAAFAAAERVLRERGRTPQPHVLRRRHRPVPRQAKSPMLRPVLWIAAALLATFGAASTNALLSLEVFSLAALLALGSVAAGFVRRAAQKAGPVSIGAKPADIVVLQTYANAVEAEAARACLEAEGIPTATAAIGAAYAINSGWTELAVRLSDVERAKELLSILPPPATELMASSAPAGRGVELEAASPPAGRGVELEASSAPAGCGVELEASSAPAGRGVELEAGPAPAGPEGERPGVVEALPEGEETRPQ